jgi:hypothetical protein
MKRSTTDRPTLPRRQLLGAAGTTGALAAAAALLPTAQQTAQPTAAKPAPEQGGGYQVTEHVLRYYQTAKV